MIKKRVMLRNNSHNQYNMRLTFYSNLGINLFIKKINKLLLRYKKLPKAGLLGGYLIFIKHQF
jgi:hypothetical protein